MRVFVCLYPRCGMLVSNYGLDMFGMNLLPEPFRQKIRMFAAGFDIRNPKSSHFVFHRLPCSPLHAFATGLPLTLISFPASSSLSADLVLLCLTTCGWAFSRLFSARECIEYRNALCLFQHKSFPGKQTPATCSTALENKTIFV